MVNDHPYLPGNNAIMDVPHLIDLVTSNFTYCWICNAPSYCIESYRTGRELLDYTSDNIFEMIVSWEWTKGLGDRGYSLRNLHMRCPKCGGLLSQHSSVDYNNYVPFPIIKCNFKGCGWKIASDMERLGYGEMQARLAEEIDRRCFQKFRS